ncbi:hypothetical protein IFM89_034042 [Coptis chinensis]|uniref:RRM domain-containing protein n=1 Tax=Coptis chinensis TaxID=261450 RepID=A0A835MAU3_9MAGN|nr:hypothetical protein IFM89_034042 [Coptis chinensis]
MGKKRKGGPKVEEPIIHKPIPEPEEEEEEIETSEDDEGLEEVETSSSSEEEEVKKKKKKKKETESLLEPFGKDQLIEILKQAALNNSSIFRRLTQAAETDTIHRKIFVHGLSWDATTETLLETFKQYGQIEDCNVVMDKLTGNSKGFGFVLFKKRIGASKALKDPQKKIGNRMTACQLASFGSVPNHPVPDPTGRKIYVANALQHVNPERLKDFFSKFGEIEEGPLGVDRNTGKLRGFALFVYKTTEGCKKALEEPEKLFEGCHLQCKRALDGVGRQKNQNTGENAMLASVGLSTGNVPVPVNYEMGFNPGMVGQNLGLNFPPAAGTSLMGQNHHGIMNTAALGTTLTQTGYSPSVGRGMSPTTNQSEAGTTLGLRAAYGMPSNINTISPSVIGSYGSQAALQGLGVYQNAQLGQSLARSQSGIASLGIMPPNLGR